MILLGELSYYSCILQVSPWFFPLCVYFYGTSEATFTVTVQV